jgi:hypothetical protein
MKSKSIWNTRPSYGMPDVVRPRGVTYKVTCHEWLAQGVLASRTLPTICVHRCSVVQVSFHSPYGKAGHSSVHELLDGCMIGVSSAGLRPGNALNGGTPIHRPDIRYSCEVVSP